MDVTWFKLAIILCSACGIFAQSRLYYMEDVCGHFLDFNRLGLESVRIQLTKFQFYHNNMDCLVRLQAPTNKRIQVKVLKRVIVATPDCTGDFLRVFDGSEPRGPVLSEMPDRICDNTRMALSYVSTGPNVTVTFHSDAADASEGFRLLLTAFRDAQDGECSDSEFTCRSTVRCISSDLECDTFEDCADGSDECTLSIPAVIGLAVGGVIVVMIVTAVVLCCLRQKRRREKSMAASSTQRLNSSDSSDQYVSTEDSVDSIDGGVLYYTPETGNTQPGGTVMAVPHVLTDGTNIVVSGNNSTQVLKKSMRRSLPIMGRDTWVTPPPSARTLKPNTDQGFFSMYNY